MEEEPIRIFRQRIVTDVTNRVIIVQIQHKMIACLVPQAVITFLIKDLG